MLRQFCLSSDYLLEFRVVIDYFLLRNVWAEPQDKFFCKYLILSWLWLSVSSFSN
jgi:hypothetical protein